LRFGRAWLDECTIGTGEVTAERNDAELDRHGPPVEAVERDAKGIALDQATRGR
jgi:hypothetical protein